MFYRTTFVLQTFLIASKLHATWYNNMQHDTTTHNKVVKRYKLFLHRKCCTLLHEKLGSFDRSLRSGIYHKSQQTPTEKQISLRHWAHEMSSDKFQGLEPQKTCKKSQNSLTTVQQTVAKRERWYFSNLAGMETIIESYPLEFIKQWLVQKNQRNTVRETKRYVTHRESISCEWNEKFTNKGKTGSLEYKSTLGIYKIAVYLWNWASVVAQENYDFFRHPRNNICRFLILPKSQKSCWKSQNNQQHSLTIAEREKIYGKRN